MLNAMGQLKPQETSFAINAVVRDSVTGEPKGFKEFQSDSGAAISDFYTQLNGIPKKRRNHNNKDNAN